MTLLVKFDVKRRLYENLPTSVKRSVRLLPFHFLAGAPYREVLNRQAFFDSADRSEILAFQERELRNVLDFATRFVPAYSHLKSDVERRAPFDALKEFPLLEKDDIQNDLERFLPTNINSIAHYETTTGGTTGNQLKILLDNSSQSVEMGFMHRQWARVGYMPRHRKATFRGVTFKNLDIERPWQENPIYNELQFSPFHMNQQNLAAYVDRIVYFQPKYFHGYASAIDNLAEYVMRNGRPKGFPNLNAILLGSEGVSDAQRERIETAFETRVFSWYGHSERVILAGECEISTDYHAMPDYGLLELVNDKGQNVIEEGSRGEIVGTGFYNRAMPLIRYRTGDLATRLDCQCECGRCWDRFSDVEGRWKQEIIVGKNGAKISLAALNMHGKVFTNVIRYQYFQDTPGELVIRLMTNPSFGESDMQSIQSAYTAKVAGELNVKPIVVEDIKLTPRGKLKRFETRLTT